MTRRLLTAGLLLAALAWCGRAAAKPPDLPLENKDVLAPQDPLAPAETAARRISTRSPRPPKVGQSLRDWPATRGASRPPWRRPSF